MYNLIQIGDCFLRYGGGGGWKRSAGETLKQMKRFYNWYKKKEVLWI